MEAETVTAGGLIIPDTAKEKPVKGEVVAGGPGRYSDTGQRIEMSVEVGEKVLYNKYAGNEVKLDGVIYLVMRDHELMGVVD
jgi:chaperonin GroES